MRRKRLILFAALACLLAFGYSLFGGGATSYHKNKWVVFETDTSGDTAQILTVLVEADTARDSLVYTCSLVTSGGGTDTGVTIWVAPVESYRLHYDTSNWFYDSVRCSLSFIFHPSSTPDTLRTNWTSPTFTMKVTPTAKNTEQYVDTFILGGGDTLVATYTSDGTATVAEITSNMTDSINATATLGDSVLAVDATTHYLVKPEHSSRTTGYTMDFTLITCDDQDTATDTARASLATFCDSITAYINATSDLTDSVEAQDSATYVKIVSLFSQETFTERWVFLLDTTAAVAGSLGTKDQTICTAAMVCDSMVVKVNADDTASVYVTAANSGDTAFTITSNDNGLGFSYFSDDFADTVSTQGNVTSWSTNWDTLQLDIPLMDLGFQVTDMWLRVTLNACSVTAQGLGNSDSCEMKLYSAIGRTLAKQNGRDSVLGDTLVMIRHDTGTTIPYTLVLDTSSIETSLLERLVLEYLIADSATDSIMHNLRYHITYDVILRGD